MNWWLSVLVITGVATSVQSLRKFPEGFRFGTATAAYQIEGAWNASDKSESVWDHYTHYQSHKIKDGSNGDVACDSYHLYKRDVQMLVELGVDYYRFSISWSRLLPAGYGRNVSRDGLRYYNNLIDELIKYNITPMVTLFHWDTPQVLMDIGGWANPLIVDFFEDYVRLVFEHFGDRVKTWLTFNEPYNMCLVGYGSRRALIRLAPDLNFHGIAEYQCTHHVLRAHARAYHLYNDTFKPTQKGRVGMATVILWAEPETGSAEDVAIAEKALEFTAGWYLNPIHNSSGDYPHVMRQEVDRLSKLQGFKQSRLPVFTPEEVQALKGAADFIGINYYTSIVYRNTGARPERDVPSHEHDLGYTHYQPEQWETGGSSWLKIRPKQLRILLNWVKKKYGDEEIYITETGYSSGLGLRDEERVNFINQHLQATLDAVEDGVKVTRFTVWSLMDNFEWSNGYTESFGLYQVDYTSPQKTRTPRMAALVYKEVTRTRALNPNYRPEIREPVPIEEEFPSKMVASVVIIIFLVLLVVVLALKYFYYKKKYEVLKRSETQTVLY